MIDSLTSSLVSAIPFREKFFGPTSTALQELLVQAHLDPQLAARLMRGNAYIPAEAFSSVLGRNARAYATSGLRGLLGEFGRDEKEKNRKTK